MDYAEDWSREEEDGDESILAYDEDEDEFGLPSLANMRRKGRRQKIMKATELKNSGASSVSVSESTLTRSWSANTGDIAEERGLPNYPITRTSSFLNL